jgi:transmembrane sensor
MQFELIIKKIKNKLSSEEEVVFRKWYDSDARHQDYFEQVRKNYSRNYEPIESKKAWTLISEKLNLKRPKQYWKMAIAASIIVLIGLFSFLNFRASFSESSLPAIAITLIEETEGKAILTLGNGTDVVLTSQGYQNTNITSNGSELIYKDISSHSSSEEIIYNYITVPRGGEFFVQLSDGSKVWLNADSKLKFPVEFKGTSREVELVYGEAYFEVSPSTLHKGANFIVKNQKQTIEVLGTEFNLKAYRDDKNIITTLVEGKVTLKHIDVIVLKSLTPSQQATFNSQTNTFNIEHVDTEDTIAWRKGVLRFQNKSLKDIMLALSRWYDLEVTFEDENIKHRKFNGVFRKTQKIENILESIQKTQEANFLIDDKKIFVENPVD